MTHHKFKKKPKTAPTLKLLLILSPIMYLATNNNSYVNSNSSRGLPHSIPDRISLFSTYGHTPATVQLATTANCFFKIHICLFSPFQLKTCTSKTFFYWNSQRPSAGIVACRLGGFNTMLKDIVMTLQAMSLQFHNSEKWKISTNADIQNTFD